MPSAVLRLPAGPLAVAGRPEGKVLTSLLQGLSGLLAEAEEASAAVRGVPAQPGESAVVSSRPMAIERPRHAVD
jgi:hypothetical protein